MGFDANDLARERGLDAVARLVDAARPYQPKPPNGAAAFTEDAIAPAFADEYAGRLLHCSTRGAWFWWTGAIWQQEPTPRAFNAVREAARAVAARATAQGVAASLSRASTARGVEAFAKADPRLAAHAGLWDRDPMLLATPAGTVDLRTGRVRAADPCDHITRATAVAPAETADCPRWLQFLDEATCGDHELTNYLQRMAGYCLSGSTREHALFFVHGGGGNGKSVFLNALTGILGDYAAVAPMEALMASHGDRHPTEVAMLAGARLAACSETEEGRSWAEARLKQLTGGDAISARFMRRDFFTFQPAFKLLIVGNHAPALRNVDDAMRRRFNLIPFVHKPKQPDRGLEAKLRREWPGILRWAIDGCLEWQRLGLQPPAVVQATTAEYFDEQDLMAAWLDERCETGPDEWEPTARLFADWTRYATAAGEKPGTAKAFSASLVKRGFTPGRKRANGPVARVFQGLALRFDPVGSGIDHG